MNVLTTQLNTDLGTAYSTSYSSVFPTLQSQFNALVTNLNTNPTLVFVNYDQSNGTIDYELLVESVDFGDNEITVLAVTPLIQGDIVIHKAIK
ncbi:MAG: hypothetical protein ACK53L_14430, partial [Pirellulaceae bacterium]